MRKTVLLLASMILAVLLASGVALATAGDLDPSFDGPSLDGNGKVVLEQAGSSNDVRVQPDGKIVVAGGSSDGSFLLTRHMPDGTPDQSFGGGDGVVTTNMSTGSDVAKDVLVQPDGKIVAAGVAGEGRRDSSLALARYAPDGTLDDTFSTDGKVFTKPRGVDATSARALLRLPNDKLVVAGSAYQASNNGRVLLVRYLANGRRDESFGGDGIVMPRFEGLAWDVVRQKANGKIIVAGSEYPAGTGEGSAFSDLMFMRRLPDGSPDKSFSTDGKKLVDAGSGLFGTYVHEAARALILRPDGKIVAAGGAYYWGTTDGSCYASGRLALVRLEPNGALDLGFGGGDGKVIGGMTPFGAYDLLRQQDGKLIAVGTHYVFGEDAELCITTAKSFALRGYNPNGSLDASFGSGGEVLTSFPASFSSAYASALQADGKVVAAGDASNRVALARYLTE
jgi:uncharacterized delta-60 repeat protein